MDPGLTTEIREKTGKIQIRPEAQLADQPRVNFPSLVSVLPGWLMLTLGEAGDRVRELYCFCNFLSICNYTQVKNSVCEYMCVSVCTAKLHSSKSKPKGYLTKCEG